MNPELRAKIIAYNKAVKENSGKSSDLEKIVAAFNNLPLAPLKSILPGNIITVLRKYGIEI